jgi:hypothetical protein
VLPTFLFRFGVDVAFALTFAAISTSEGQQEVNPMHQKLFGILTAMTLSVGCGGSNKQAESPQQEPSAGDKMEQAGEDTEKAAEKATESAGEEAEKAGDKVKEKTKDEE